MAIAQWSIQAHIGQLATADVLLLGSHIRKDDAARAHTKLLCLGQDVGLTMSWETQQPHHRLGHTLQDLSRQHFGSTCVGCDVTASVVSQPLILQGKEVDFRMMCNANKTQKLCIQSPQ